MNEQKLSIYFLLVAFFSIAFLIANILGISLLKIGTITLTSGTLVYPITFLISDLVTEVWGGKRANLMVGLSFLLGIFVLGLLLFWQKSVRLSGIMIFSSLTAFVCGQLLDIRIFEKIKAMTRGKSLWIRNQISTYISQIIDTLIVNSLLLFWGLKLDMKTALLILCGNFGYKLFFTILTAPLLYFFVKILRKRIAYENQ